MTELAPQPALEVDLFTDEYTKMFETAPLYAKKVLVKIRKAVPGEALTTVLGNGTVETTNTAGEADVVITNPGGEEYMVSEALAMQRNDPTEVEGVYRARGISRIFPNPTGSSVVITPPWGGRQEGGADCMFAVTVEDLEHLDVIGNDRYLIGGDEYRETYGLAFEVLPEQFAPTTE